MASDGRVLIAQRPPGKPSAGYWEFPGGKLKPGESRPAGLARELREELGIEIRDPRPLIRLRHTYPYGEVLIDMWVIKSYEGQPQGLDGQELRWCKREELDCLELLPADRPIVRVLGLPEQLDLGATAEYRVEIAPHFSRSHTLTHDIGEEPRQAVGAYCSQGIEAKAAAAAGADFIVMSLSLPGTEVEALCADIMLPVFVKDFSLRTAWAMGASGISHLRL